MTNSPLKDPTKLSTPTRLEENTLKLRLPFGALFLHVGQINGVIHHVTYSMQGKDTNPEIEAILTPIFEGITQEISDIRGRFA